MTDPRPVPSLDEIALDPAKAIALSLDAATMLLARGGAACEVLRARVGTLQLASAPARVETADAVEWLTVPEVAARLKLARSYVYQLARRGDLPAVRRGKYVRIPAGRLHEWVAALEGNGVDTSRYTMYHRRRDRRRAPGTPQAARTDAGSVS